MQYLMFLIGIVLGVLIIKIFNRKIEKSIKLKKYNRYMFWVVQALLAAVVLEIFTFNFTSYEKNNNPKFAVMFDTKTLENTVTSDSNEIVEKNKAKNGNVEVSKEGETRLYSVIVYADCAIKDLDLSMDGAEKTADCKVYYKDEANTVEYAKADCNVTLVNGLASTGHIKTHFAGKTDSVKLTLEVPVESSISKIYVKVNYSKAFKFNAIRTIVMMIFIMLFTLIRFTGSIEFVNKTKNIHYNRKILVTIMILQVGFVVLLAGMTNASFDYAGRLTGFDFSTNMDAYQELTVALANGKVDINGVSSSGTYFVQSQIEQLNKLKNPYEWKQRSNIKYKWDRAFYKGKYYCYFGVVPVLFVYLPIYMVTGALISTKIYVLMMCVICMFLMCNLIMTIVNRWKKPVNVWVIASLVVCFISSSFLLYSINGSKFYEAASISALASALMGIDCILNAFTEKGIKKKRLLLGATFMALAVGCRPNFVLGSIIIVPIVLNGLATNGGYNRINKVGKTSVNEHKKCNYFKAIFSRKNIKEIITFALPYLVIGIALMYYNYIRFGSITEFGAKYQLTVYDTSYYHITDIGKLPVAISKGLLMPPSVSSVFPYLNPTTTSSNYMGFFYSMACMGIFAYPIMWLLALIPWTGRRTIKETGNKGFVMTTLVVAFAMCYITTTMGGTSLRYSIDYAWMFFLPIIYVVLIMYSKAREKGLEGYVTIIMIGLAIASFAITAMVAISPEWSNIKYDSPVLFYYIKQMLVFWK